MYVHKYIIVIVVSEAFTMYSLYYIDALEFDFFLTHQLFISISELCSAMMQKYPLITAFSATS